MQFGELLRRRDHAMRADLPLELGRHQIGLLLDDALETRIVVGKTRDFRVHRRELRQHGADPQRGAGHLVGEPEHIENLCRTLPDRDDARGRMVEGYVAPAIFQRQRIVGRFGEGRGGGKRHECGGAKCGEKRMDAQGDGPFRRKASEGAQDGNDAQEKARVLRGT